MFFGCIFQTCALQQSELVRFSWHAYMGLERCPDFCVWQRMDLALSFSIFFFSVPVNMLTWACVSTSLLHVCVCACVRACVCVSVCVYMCVCVSKQANGLADWAKQNLIGQSTFIWYKKRNVLQWFPFNLIKYDLVNSFFLSIPCIYYIHAYIIISHNINHNEKSNKTVSICVNTDWAYISNVMEFIGTHI